MALLVHDPLQSDLPPSARMTVTDGELQIMLEVGRDKHPQRHSGGDRRAAAECVRLDPRDRRAGAAAQRRRGDRAANSPPAGPLPRAAGGRGGHPARSGSRPWLNLHKPIRSRA